MTRALVPLSMSSISQLPERCRTCVTWEVTASAAIGLGAGDAAFEKEVWLSGVMLTWGSAGMLVTVDDEPAGFALYAPPTAVPGGSAFPTSPVSPDAVLLTVARIANGHTGQGLGRYLLEGVVTALARRGVRAVEAFGLEAPADPGAPAGPAEGEPDPEPPRTCAADLCVPADPALPQCLNSAGFLRAVGFTVVGPHHRYPRLRYELTAGLGWKAEVESALEKLFTVISVPAPKAAEPVLMPAGAGGRRT